MNETQRRIQAYKEALPKLRERVIAVALLLAMSVSMMTSVSFAWLTISRAPEVTGVNTTIAANGSLEIALSNAVGTEPSESRVGDSMSAAGQSVLVANQTWGNLINLSDPLYGLEHLALRPAQLNTASLLDSPLYGAVYNRDGRITELTSNFKYATWIPPEGLVKGYFGVSDNKGVRAISSVTYAQIEGSENAAAQAFELKKGDVDKINSAAGSKYVGLANNQAYMQSLATMMGLYMTSRMNPDEATLNNPDCNIADIVNLKNMYAEFLEAIELEGDALTALVNLQLYLLGKEENFTKEQLYASTSASLKALVPSEDPNKFVLITDLVSFIQDRNTIKSDLAKLETLCAGGTSLKWKDSGLNGIVNNLVDVGKCTIGADNTPISSIGASNAMGYLSGTQEAKITNGILYRFEERTGRHLEVKGLSISATVKRLGMTIPATVKANVSVTAPRDYYLFNNDLVHASSMYTGGGSIAYMAQDTYGMAIDLWVRSNASGSYLTLEGNVLTTPETVDVKGKDANGNTVDLYTYSVKITENGKESTVTKDVYQEVNGSGENEIVTWKDAVTFEIVTIPEGTIPTPKIDIIDKVIGYEGINRIWGEDETLSVDSTSQGSGSCYIYYADTPEDQAQSLSLLEAFKVAFVDSNGKLLATASMDTKHHYAASGRVIVPLKLDASNSISLGEDINGQVQYAITNLVQNTAHRITTIVYLDGTKLTNDDVLAASDIQGQLNIQFGSSQSLKPIDDETLQTAERRVSASISQNYFDYDTHEGPMTTTVTVNVSGDQPNNVKAFFMRQINASQGSREKTINFTKDASGAWIADYTFNTPGKYVLRTIQLDGKEYVLDTCPEVTVEGFAIASLTCDKGTDNYINVMTAGNSETVNLYLKFAADDSTKLPSTVQGRFLRADGSATNIDFDYDTTDGIWKGPATFISSGEYTLQYLVLNGEYTELPESLWQTANIRLGMKVAVYTISQQNYTYDQSNHPTFDMQVKIMDNTGRELEGLEETKLTYPLRGSVTKKMDTDLEWNASTGYYTGVLKSVDVKSPGILEFGSVSVGTNVITNATTAPTFRILPPDPPSYYGWNSSTYQYAPNGGAKLTVLIENGFVDGASAKITSAEGESVVVVGKQSDYDTADGASVAAWTFDVPQNTKRTCSNNCEPKCEEGHWMISELQMWGVVKEDGVSVYDEKSPYKLTISENRTTVAVHKTANFVSVEGQHIGKSADGTITGLFLQDQDITGLNLKLAVRDFEGNTLLGNQSIKVTFKYDGGADSHGGYSASSESTFESNFKYLQTEDDGTNVYVQDDVNIPKVKYAGVYKATAVTVTSRDGKTITYANTDLPLNPPTFEVWSKKPSEFNASQTANLGQSNSLFMNAQTISGWTVEKSAFDFVDASLPAEKLQSVVATFDYVGEHETYGKFTTDSNVDLATAVDSSGKEIAEDKAFNFAYSNGKYVLSGEYTANYAGKYAVEAVTYTLDDGKVTIGGLDTTKSPSFAISSIKPYIKFTATNPAVGETFTGANEDASGTVNRKNSISADGYSTTCYFEASGESDGCGGGSCSGYKAPKATTTLNNPGSFKSASMVIKSNGSAGDVKYQYTPDKLSNEQALGTDSNERKGIGANAQGTTLIVVGTDGLNYTFRLDNALSATAQY